MTGTLTAWAGPERRANLLDCAGGEFGLGKLRCIERGWIWGCMGGFTEALCYLGRGGMGRSPYQGRRELLGDRKSTRLNSSH